MMNWDEYMSTVKSDALDVIGEIGKDYEEWEELYDALFVDDSVTGNGSGSYTMSSAKAAENVAGIIWDEEFAERCKEYGYDGVPTDQGPEAVDVIARCLALGELSGELCDAWEEEKRATVTDAHGKPVNFEAASHLMDDDIREALHNGPELSNQAFFDAYADAHRAKYGEDFAPYVGGAW